MYYNEKETALRLRQIRKDRGITQARAAQKLGIGYDSLGGVERGVRGYSLELLICMSELYHVSMDYLVLGRTQEEGMNQKGLEELIRYLLARRSGLVEGMQDPVPDIPLPEIPG